ncbi:MAG: PhoH family protein [Verrucomicrobiota bacterium]
MIAPEDSAQTRLVEVSSPSLENGTGTGNASGGRGGLIRGTEPEYSGLRAPLEGGKNFVLDTNVLLHDPGCLHRFADNHVCIPVDVLSELDRFKNEQSERGANARAVHRSLTELFTVDEEAVTRGAATPGGGTLRLVTFDPREASGLSVLDRFYRVFPGLERVDNRILACALMVMSSNGGPVVLVTKDLNMQLKARAVGITCEDYLTDKVAQSDVGYELTRIEVDSKEMQRFASSKLLELDKDRIEGLSVNQYVLLAAGAKETMPARLAANGVFVRLRIPEAIRIQQGMSLKPINLGQQCFFDALFNPDISLVTCFGQAGTGKTLLGVAAGLSQVLSRGYNGLTVSRPVVAMGDTMGYLPGSLDEKMRPWLQPIYDALDLLMRPPRKGGGARRKAAKGEAVSELPALKPYEELIQDGAVEIEALCYIRGRSIPNRFFVLDEAQQLTPLEAKTVVTRMSRGSKLVMIGDPAQIDNPYVDRRSNGLVYTRTRMKGQPFAAHVSLCKGERSDLAEAGAQLM